MRRAARWARRRARASDMLEIRDRLSCGEGCGGNRYRLCSRADDRAVSDDLTMAVERSTRESEALQFALGMSWLHTQGWPLSSGNPLTELTFGAA